jgi:hypothetical protein
MASMTAAYPGDRSSSARSVIRSDPIGREIVAAVAARSTELSAR